jgi:Chaperone of endosialidase
VMYSKYSGCVVSLLVVLPMILTAQRAQENVVLLKNWSTPLYWHPNQVESEAAAQALPRSAAPQFQLSPSAASPNALTFVAITPCRLVDTRGSGGGFDGIAPFSGSSILGATAVTFPVQSATEAMTNTTPAPCGVIPAIAEAYSFNLTVIPQGGGEVGYVTLWPANATQPVVATLNDRQGLIVDNAAIVAAGTPSGGVSVYNSGPTTIDVVIDMNGFFAAPSDLNGNTAIGAGTLASNTGSGNTASGAGALQDNTTGTDNVASGYQALQSNTTGMESTASGAGALQANTTGSSNTANGFGAMLGNTSGGSNTASGYLALSGNTMGAGNTAIGASALSANTTGGSNIAVGDGAGANAPGINSFSIYIGSAGTASDNAGTIQIGNPATAASFFAAGVSGMTTGLGDAIPVVIDSNGQLGTAISSQRFKEDIQDMGDASSGLLRLRPVTFRYKQAYQDGSKPIDYGLIAEEVAQVYPGLAVKGLDGKVETVQYQKLTPMLLNELQKQAEQIRSLEDRLAALEALLSAVPEPVR